MPLRPGSTGGDNGGSGNDPGHGGHRRVGGSSPNNATGPSGQLEKTVTLGIARAARDDPGQFRVLLTREDDANLGLTDRASVARLSGAVAFVSVHCNGSKDPTVQRSSAYIHERGSAESMRLAEAVLSRVRDVTGSRPRQVQRAACSAYCSPRATCPRQPRVWWR
ncbi:N-acetylmuramoyl-L-alanine amidase family protein [Ramlibacter henchirensis]